MTENTDIESKHAVNESMLDFFAEAGLLKRVRRSGWWTIGIKNGESVADHSFRCSLIAFCLAKQEGVDPYKSAMIALFNDIHEARINDLHKVSQRYVDLRKAEKQAFEEQVGSLPENLGDSINDLLQELWKDETKEAVIARDADILECMLQGKEYFDEGHLGAEAFFDDRNNLLKTETARSLARSLKVWNSRDWLKKLVRLER